MPDFQKGPNYVTPFGRNQWLRSTQDVKTESYTFAAGLIPTETIDGSEQKVLQPGTVLAKATSGADAGKIGVYNRNATDGRETAANIVGVCNTFLPWQLLERDVEVAAVYEATGVQAWCFEYVDEGVYNGGAFGGVANGTMIRIALTDTTADLMRGQKNLDIMFA